METKRLEEEDMQLIFETITDESLVLYLEIQYLDTSFCTWWVDGSKKRQHIKLRIIYWKCMRENHDNESYF